MKIVFFSTLIENIFFRWFLFGASWNKMLTLVGSFFLLKLLLLLFSKSQRIIYFFLIVFLGIVYESIEAQLCQVQASTRKHLTVPSTKKFSTVRQNVSDEKSWYPLLSRKFFDNGNFQKHRRVTLWNFWVASDKKNLDEKSWYNRFAYFFDTRNFLKQKIFLHTKHFRQNFLVILRFMVHHIFGTWQMGNARNFLEH